MANGFDGPEQREGGVPADWFKIRAELEFENVRLNRQATDQFTVVVARYSIEPKDDYRFASPSDDKPDYAAVGDHGYYPIANIDLYATFAPVGDTRRDGDPLGRFGIQLGDRRNRGDRTITVQVYRDAEGQYHPYDPDNPPSPDVSPELLSADLGHVDVKVALDIDALAEIAGNLPLPPRAENWDEDDDEDSDEHDDDDEDEDDDHDEDDRDDGDDEVLLYVLWPLDTLLEVPFVADMNADDYPSLIAEGRRCVLLSLSDMEELLLLSFSEEHTFELYAWPADDAMAFLRRP